MREDMKSPVDQFLRESYFLSLIRSLYSTYIHNRVLEDNILVFCRPFNNFQDLRLLQRTALKQLYTTFDENRVDGLNASYIYHI